MKKKKENMSEVIFALEWKKFPSSKQQKKEEKYPSRKDVHLKSILKWDDPLCGYHL